MKDLIRKQIQLVHPEKVYSYLPGFQKGAMANIYGLGEEEFAEIRNSINNELQEIAKNLLTDTEFKQALHSAFHQGERIMMIGESTTDDLLSWFEIVRVCVQIELPEKSIAFSNASIAGQTTAMALRRLTADLQFKPTVVFCMLGLNDALFIGGRKGKPQVSLEETFLNFSALYNIAWSACKPEWYWITPHPIDERKQDNNKWFEQLQLRWNTADLIPIRGYLNGTANGRTIDIYPLFKDNPGFLLEDGIHASPKFHEVIAKKVMYSLNKIKR